MGYGKWLATGAVAAAIAVSGVALSGVARAQDPNAGSPYASPYASAPDTGSPYNQQAPAYGNRQYMRGGFQGQGQEQANGNGGMRANRMALRHQLNEDIRAGRPRAAARDARQLAMARMAMRQQFRGGMQGSNPEGPGGPGADQNYRGN